MKSVKHQLWDQVYYRVWDKDFDQVERQVFNQVEYEVRDQVGVQVLQVYIQIWNKVKEKYETSQKTSL